MELSDLNLLINSGVPIVCISTPAQERITVLQKIYHECAVPRNLPLFVWNLAWGAFKLFQSDFQNQVSFSDLEANSLHGAINIFNAFDYFLNSNKDGLFILENLSSLFSGTLTSSGETSAKMTSHLINVYHELKNSKKCKYLLILATDNVELPQSLSGLIPTISIPLPSIEQISNIITECLQQVGSFEVSSLVSAASGLTREEIRNGLTIAVNSCYFEEQIDVTHIAEHLLSYKIDYFRSFNLNFVAKPYFPDFGGLDLLKKYLENVKQDFLPQARDAGIPLPKGCLLVGPPGTGKTLAAHVGAKILSFPLVSVDTAAVVSGGATYLKHLIERVEVCAPVVLYFDEFDKLFTASTLSGEDMGSRQILGTLLTWLQDKKSTTFVVATLNRLDALPPELTRVGRFDEIFYVGFPQAIERKQILTMHLARFDQRYCDGGAVLSEKEWRIILNKTVNCTGAELARIVEKAARTLFHQGQQMNIGLTELLEQREMMVPLYARDTDRILAIENRAKYICQPASSLDFSEYAPAITSFWGDVPS
jgi:ATP-dependent 26S proteasome regulatory subunit